MEEVNETQIGKRQLLGPYLQTCRNGTAGCHKSWLRKNIFDNHFERYHLQSSNSTRDGKSWPCLARSCGCFLTKEELLRHIWTLHTQVTEPPQSSITSYVGPHALAGPNTSSYNPNNTQPLPLQPGAIFPNAAFSYAAPYTGVVQYFTPGPSSQPSVFLSPTTPFNDVDTLLFHHYNQYNLAHAFQVQNTTRPSITTEWHPPIPPYTDASTGQPFGYAYLPDYMNHPGPEYQPPGPDPRV